MPTPDPYPTGARPTAPSTGDARFRLDAPMAHVSLSDDVRLDAMPPDADLDAHLAALLATVPRCPAPPGFTDRVMAALPAAPTPAFSAPLRSAPGTTVARPAAPRAAGRMSRWRVRWGSAATLALVVIVIGASLIGLPRRSQPAAEAPVSAAEVAEAREQLELALSLLGTAHRKAETDAARLIAP